MVISNISSLIKEQRLKLGLSLSELSRRTDTSVATLSRYENGWHRFEVYTLEKLALALGCKLNIQFEPLKQKHDSRNLSQAIKQWSRLFWDHKLSKKDLKNYPQWVVERILEYGTLADVHLLIAIMRRKNFLQTLAKCRFQSQKTSTFWQQILKKEGIKCTKNAFPRDVWIS